MARVLDLDLSEVFGGSAIEIHSATGMQAEIHRVGGTDKFEAQPVHVVGAVALVGCEKAFRGRVGTHDQSYIGRS